jgi:hypothetical protein
VIIVLGFDNGDGQIGFIIKEVISPSRFGPAYGIAPDKHPAIGDIHFLPDLVMVVPS